MNFRTTSQKSVLLLAGALIALAVMVLIGAGYPSQVGRYRMATISRNTFTDIYVIDTATGIVKYVGKDQGKPFDAIKGQ